MTDQEKLERCANKTIEKLLVDLIHHSTDGEKMRTKLRLNKEELGIGLVFGSAYFLFTGWWTLLIAPVCSFFWAWSGAGADKVWRRLGCPALVCITAAILARSWVPPVSIPIVFGVLTLGYGLPEFSPAGDTITDEGSWLGNVCFKWCKGDEIKANYLTRGTYAALITIGFLPLSYINPFYVVIGNVLLVTGLLAAVHYLEGILEV